MTDTRRGEGMTKHEYIKKHFKVVNGEVKAIRDRDGLTASISLDDLEDLWDAAEEGTQ